MKSDLLPPAEMQRELALAMRYMQEQGSAQDCSRLTALLSGERAPGAAAEWERRMDASGGVALEADSERGPSVAGTALALMKLHDQRIHGSAAAGRMLAFVRRSQCSDGRWLPADGAADLKSTLALTSAAAFWLAVLAPEQTDSLGRAARVLQAELVGTVLAQAEPRTLAQVAAFAWRYLGAESELCRRAFGALASYLPAPGSWRKRMGLSARRRGRLSAAALADALTCFLLVGLGGVYTVPVHGALSELGRAQGEDGSWPGDAAGVETTLAAVRVLLGYGLW